MYKGKNFTMIGKSKAIWFIKRTNFWYISLLNDIEKHLLRYLINIVTLKILNILTNTAAFLGVRDRGVSSKNKLTKATPRSIMLR